MPAPIPQVQEYPNPAIDDGYSYEIPGSSPKQLPPNLPTSFPSVALKAPVAYPVHPQPTVMQQQQPPQTTTTEVVQQMDQACIEQPTNVQLNATPSAVLPSEMGSPPSTTVSEEDLQQPQAVAPEPLMSTPVQSTTSEPVIETVQQPLPTVSRSVPAKLILPQDQPSQAVLDSSPVSPSRMSQEQLFSTAQALMSELANDLNFSVGSEPSVSPQTGDDKSASVSPAVNVMSDLDLKINQLNNTNEMVSHELLFNNPEEGVSRNICAFCQHRVLVGPYYDVGGGKRVHVDCFKCKNCGNHLTQFQCLNDSYLCPQCAHKLRPPAKCVACGKVVSSDDAVVALNTEWHRSCFRCAHCRKILDKEFVELNGKPYCLPRESPCYRIAQGKVCCVCSGVLDVSYLTVFEKFYHRTCFCCSGCGVPFPSLEFFQINKQPYCETCATQIIGDQLDSDSVSTSATAYQ